MKLEAMLQQHEDALVRVVEWCEDPKQETAAEVRELYRGLPAELLGGVGALIRQKRLPTKLRRLIHRKRWRVLHDTLLLEWMEREKKLTWSFAFREGTKVSFLVGSESMSQEQVQEMLNADTAVPFAPC